MDREGTPHGEYFSLYGRETARGGLDHHGFCVLRELFSGTMGVHLRRFCAVCALEFVTLCKRA